MMWEKVKLQDICVHTVSGGTPLSTREDYYFPKEVPWLKTKEVNYKRIYETEHYISVLGLNNSGAKIVPVNSVIVAMYGQGDTAGRVAINKIPVSTNQACCNLIVDKDKADYNFIFYLLSTCYEKLVSLKNGGAQPNLNVGLLKEFEVYLPDLQTQNKISSILTAYDDLIENNQKQIKLLEEAAQRLYKEWFVDLRFPGYEDVEIIDGVPKGWMIKKALDVFDITIGRTPPRSQRECFTNNDNDNAWVSIADMGKSDTFILETNENLTDEAVKAFNIPVVPRGTILLSFKLTVGRVAIASKYLCTNEAIAHFRINDATFREYLYFYLKHFNYDALGNTSAISKAINSTIVKNMDVVLPDKFVLSKFHALVESIFDKIEILQNEIKHLKETRDRLLPKLMSGEVEV